MRINFNRRNNKFWALGFFVLGLLSPLNSYASATSSETLDLTQHWVGYASILVFVLAYALVISEEFVHLRKSKPVILAAGVIWLMIAFVYSQHGDQHTAEAAIRHNLLEYAELFLFLLDRKSVV